MPQPEDPSFIDQAAIYLTTVENRGSEVGALISLAAGVGAAVGVEQIIQHNLFPANRAHDALQPQIHTLQAKLDSDTAFLKEHGTNNNLSLGLPAEMTQLNQEIATQKNIANHDYHPNLEGLAEGGAALVSFAIVYYGFVTAIRHYARQARTRARRAPN